MKKTAHKIKVVIVEDDPMVRDIHRRFIASIDGFTVVGEAGTGKAALDLLEEKEANLVILDVYMPEMDGIDALRFIREKGRDLDVIMITAAQGGDIIKEASRLGVFAYLIKPFTFERFAHALESYKRYYYKLEDKEGAFSQDELNGFFLAGDKGPSTDLPKGLHNATLQKTIDFMRDKGNQKAGISASELGAHLGVSRVTARRYLEYLVRAERAVVQPEYQEWGRPVNRYRLLN